MRDNRSWWHQTRSNSAGSRSSTVVCSVMSTRSRTSGCAVVGTDGHGVTAVAKPLGHLQRDRLGSADGTEVVGRHQHTKERVRVVSGRALKRDQPTAVKSAAHVTVRSMVDVPRARRRCRRAPASERPGPGARGSPDAPWVGMGGTRSSRGSLGHERSRSADTCCLPASSDPTGNVVLLRRPALAVAGSNRNAGTSVTSRVSCSGVPVVAGKTKRTVPSRSPPRSAWAALSTSTHRAAARCVRSSLSRRATLPRLQRAGADHPVAPQGRVSERFDAR